MREAKTLGDLSEENKKQILTEWKKGYAKGLIDALAPSGDLLQIGFSRDIADYFQKHQIKSHTIIASTPEAIQEGIEWASKDPSRKLIQGSWEKELPKLGKFNSILYFEYSDLDHVETLNYIFSDEILAQIGKAKELLGDLSKEMALVTVKYSNEDLEKFYEKIGKHKRDKLGNFLRNLMVNGNITKEQYGDFIEKHELKDLDVLPQNIMFDKSGAMVACLEECLKNHLQVGGRFVSYSNDIISKYDDSNFFDKVISNYGVDYQEKLIPLRANGKNFDALVVVVEKKQEEGSPKSK